jgi:hypothetical protein
MRIVGLVVLGILITAGTAQALNDTNVGVNNDNTNRNTNTNVGINQNTNANTVNPHINPSVDVSNNVAARKREAHSAVAAGLAAYNCFGSGSLAGQTAVIGIGLAKTYESENCVILRTSEYFRSMALVAAEPKMAASWHAASQNVLCQDDIARKAFKGIALLECPEEPAVTYAAVSENKQFTVPVEYDYPAYRKRR